MARLLRFRAWDAERKLMTSSDLVEFYFDKHGELKGKNYNRAGNVQLLEIMQFTGLQDSAGVDIYENDLISDHVGIGVVRYLDSKAAFRVVYGFPLLHVDGLAKWFIDYSLRGEKESIKVIGNIHENPELIGE